MGRRAALLVLAVFGIAATPAAHAQDVARGQQLFALCSRCHSAQGQGAPLALAPSIAGLDAWYVEAQLQKFRDGSRATHFDDLAGMRMRGMARWLKTDDDVKAVAAYVSSLPKTRPESLVKGGDPVRGAALYATCAGCHGANAEGVQAVGAPAMNHTSDWYLETQLKNYKQGIRGSDPRDVTGVAMRSMSIMLADDQAIKDVLAHITALGASAGTGSE